MVRPTYSGPCEAAGDLILKKQVESLAPQEGEFLARHLADCPSCRELSAGVNGTTSGLELLGRVDFTPRAELRDAVLSHVRALKTGRRPSRILRPVSRRRSRRTASAVRRNPPARTWPRLIAAAAVAAAAVLAVGLWRYLPKTPTVRAAPESYTYVGFIRGEGGAELLRAGRSVELRAGQRVLDGDRFRTSSDTQLAVFFRDGSAAVLNRGTELSVLRAEGRKCVELARGDVFAAVVGKPGQHFALNKGLPDQVLVTGTSFEVSRDESSTRLRVAAGSVRFGLGERAVTVTTNLSCRAAKGSAPSDPEPLASGSDVAAWRVNTPPVAEALSLKGEGGEPMRICQRGSDPERDPQTFTVLKEPAHGKLSGNAPNLVYTPEPGFSGEDSFTFRSEDGRARSKPARVTISVAPLPEPPVPSIMAMPTSGTAPLSVTFDASGSRVPLAPAKFTWDFGDGGVAAGARVEHVFEKPGSYSVKLTVTDARERSSTAEVVIRALERWKKKSSSKKSSKPTAATGPSATPASGTEPASATGTEPKETGKPVKQPVAKGKGGDEPPPGQAKSTPASSKKPPKKKPPKKRPPKKKPPKRKPPKKPSKK
jgi:ferric-dicitrate binding protein FerR (iron transport regulator)